MTAKDERARGVEILTEILSAGRVLRIKEPRTFHNGYSYYFEVTAYDKVADFCLSAEVLEDMEGTPGYNIQGSASLCSVPTSLAKTGRGRNLTPWLLWKWMVGR
jgi:hypothetical protein